MHARHRIRQAIVAALTGAGTLAGARVSDNPSNPRTVFPALTVEDRGEQQRATTLGGAAARNIERSCTFIVTAEIQQSSTSDPAGARDELLGQVEAALAVTAIPGVKSITPAGYAPDSEFDGQRPIYIGRQAFDVLYYTPAGDPTTTL